MRRCSSATSSTGFAGGCRPRTTSSSSPPAGPPVRLEVPWGEALDPEDVDRVLAEHPEIEKVCVTHNETSTGVVNDMRAIAAVVKGRGQRAARGHARGGGGEAPPG